jgi:ABC-type dipeptide/oligopeptide/nickel transport system ATPase component
MADNPLLEVKDLRIAFQSRTGVNEAVKGISFTLEAGETLAVVGESGSGKSVTALSLSKLLPPPPACVVDGQIMLEGEDLLSYSEKQLLKVRGKEIAYIFQEPSTSLNPFFSVGHQIAEAIRLHRQAVKDVKAEVINALDLVGIRMPEKRFKDYPHQLSGGMQQRVMIAMGLSCHPKILVADEPTTALDVTIQAQIMDLMQDLKEKLKMSIILITHNFGIVDGFADKLVVMYRGKIVESGETGAVLSKPQHPYTKALIACIPKLGGKRMRLETIDHSKLVV